MLVGITLLGIYLRQMNIYVHADVHSSFICNSQKLEGFFFVKKSKIVKKLIFFLTTLAFQRRCTLDKQLYSALSTALCGYIITYKDTHFIISS